MAVKKRSTSSQRSKRIRVKGIRRKETDTEQLAMVYWLMAKRRIRERRDAGALPPD
jgi:hypothetical protein